MEKIISKTWEERLAAIERINTLDLNKATIDDIDKIYSDLLIGFTIIGMNFREGISLYRAVNLGKKPMTFDEIKYPPKDKAKVNRASKEGEQMFYCSTVKKIPFFELDLKVGQRIGISNWINTDRLFLHNVGYTYEELKRLTEIYNTGFSIEGRSEELKSENNIKTNEHLKKAFSSKIEKSEEEKYKITIAIATILFNKPTEFLHLQDCPGLLYHTIRLEDEADNIVLKPWIIDKGIVEFQQVEYIEIIDKSDNKYTYKLLDYADTIKDGQIQWKNLQKTWILTDESDGFVFVDDEMFTISGDLIPDYNG